MTERLDTTQRDEPVVVLTAVLAGAEPVAVLLDVSNVREGRP